MAFFLTIFFLLCGLGNPQVEDGEEVIRAAVRELREECGAVVDVGDLRRVGVSVFEHAGDPVVTEDHVFIAEKFTGEDL